MAHAANHNPTYPGAEFTMDSFASGSSPLIPSILSSLRSVGVHYATIFPAGLQQAPKDRVGVKMSEVGALAVMTFPVSGSISAHKLITMKDDLMEFGGDDLPIDVRTKIKQHTTPVVVKVTVVAHVGELITGVEA